MSKETYFNQKRPTKETFVHQKRTTKETHKRDTLNQMKSTKETYINKKRRISIKRDLYRSKETHKRDVYQYEETYFNQKRFISIKRDPQKRPTKETHTYNSQALVHGKNKNKKQKYS